MRRKQAAFVGADAGIVAVILALVAISLPPTYESQVSVSSASSTTPSTTSTTITSTTTTTTTTSTSTSSTTPLVFSSAVAANGLQVKLYLNSTSMHSDGAITGFVTVANTLDQNVTVTPLPQDLNYSTWPGYWVWAIDPCGFQYIPGGYAVFQGHFTAENISLAAHNPLVLTPGPGGSCPGGPTRWGAITFLPVGGQAVGRMTVVDTPTEFRPDQLNVTSYVCTGEPGSANVCSVNPERPGLVGYWYKTSVCNGNPVCTFLPFAPFSPGQYTIVAWDDWNQYVYVTFTVHSEPPSSTSAESESTTITAPCNAPGVYCGPGFVISNASLVSASTLGENFSLLSFNVSGTYPDLQINSLSIWLANANFSEFSFPNGGNGPHLVGTVIPNWSGQDGAHYSFNVPTTGFNAVKGAGCQLWIDAYSARGGLKGDNWAEQNMTVG